MEGRNKSFNVKPFLAAAVAVVALAAIMKFTGLASFGSSVKVLFFEDKRISSWSARYNLLTGNLNKNLKLGDEECTLEVSVETDGGSISLRIVGKDGTIYFHEKAMPTSSYTVNAKGTVQVTVIANGHRGSFSVEKHTSTESAKP